MELIIKAEDICVEYKGSDVLDIDLLELYDYDRVGLVGAKGAAKKIDQKAVGAWRKSGIDWGEWCRENNVNPNDFKP